MSDEVIRKLKLEADVGGRFELMRYLVALDRLGQTTRDQKVMLRLLNLVDDDKYPKGKIMLAARFGWSPAVKIAGFLCLKIKPWLDFEFKLIELSLSPSDAVLLVCEQLDRVMYLIEWALGDEDAPKKSVNAARAWALDKSFENSRLADEACEEAFAVARSRLARDSSLSSRLIVESAATLAFSVSCEEPRDESSYSASGYPIKSYVAQSAKLIFKALEDAYSGDERQSVDEEYNRFIGRFCEYIVGIHNDPGLADWVKA